MKKYVSLFLTLCMLLTVMAPLAVMSVGATGDSAAVTATEPDTTWYDATKASLEIRDAADLLGFAKLLGEGTDFAGKTVAIKADIDLNPGWKANAVAPTNVWLNQPGKTFKGMIDGEGHKISGVYYDCRDTAENAGIFGNLMGGTTENPVGAKNLAVVNSFMAVNKKFAGGLFGVFGDKTEVGTALIENVYMDVLMVAYFTERTDYSGLGGVVGTTAKNDGLMLTIRNSIVNSTIRVDVRKTDVRDIGGFVGYNESPVVIEDCLYTGSVLSGGNRLTGFVGSARGVLTINHCLEAGDITPATWCADYNAHGSFLGISQAQGVEIANNIYTDSYYFKDGVKTLGHNIYGEVNSGNLPAQTVANNIYVSDADINSLDVTAQLAAAGMTNWTVTTTGCPMPRNMLAMFPWIVATPEQTETPAVYYDQNYDSVAAADLGYEWNPEGYTTGTYSVIDGKLVVDNSAEGAADAGLLIYTAPEGTTLTDYTISYDYTLLTVGKSSLYAGVMAYYSDAEHYVGGWVRASGIYNLQQRNGGSNYTNMGLLNGVAEGNLNSFGISAGLNKTFHIEMNIKDGQIDMTINGVTAMNPETNIELTQTGKIGIYIKGGVKASFDNIKVEKKVETVSTVTELAGYQVTDAANGKMDMRLVGVVNFPEGMGVADFSKVGFRVVANYDGVTKCIDYSTANVYTGVAGYTKGGNAVAAYTAESLGSDYVFVLPCRNVPADKTITMEVTTYYEGADGIVYGATVVFTVNANSTALGQ